MTTYRHKGSGAHYQPAPGSRWHKKLAASPDYEEIVGEHASLNVPELKAKAEAAGVEGFASMRKAELIEALKGTPEVPAADDSEGSQEPEEPSEGDD